MKFSPNIKIPDSLKRVLKRESTPTPLQEPRRPIKRNPKDNIPLNFRERSNARISLLASIVVLAILVLFFNQLDYRLIRKPAIDAQKKAAAIKEKQEAAATTGEITTASVIAVGDNLYHQSLIDAGASSDGNWNYDKIYTHIQDAIKDADIKMIDQETVFTTDHDSVSSYPSFATPTEVGDAIVKAGFNVVESANNHIDDFGEGFLTDTLNFWKTNYPDVTLLGIHDSQEDADTVKIREVNGIKIAFLDYTYGTNVGGIEGKDYMIDMIRKDKITTMIQKAKQQADCIIFVAHWGTEDETMPNEYEKQWAAYLMEQGVNVIIGGHPHVLQPYGRLTDDNGNEAVVFYSLGNFVSTQQKLEELLGGMAKFTIQKTVKDGKTSIEILTPTVEPLVMHYNSDAGEFGPYMLSDYTEELASQNGVQKYIGSGVFTLDNLKKKFNEIMSMNVTPSTGTNLLDVTIDTDLNMIDASGNIVEDTDSITAEKYYADKGIDINSENFNSADNNSGSTDGSSDDTSDDGSDSYDDGPGEYTETLLDTVEKYNIHVTFFMLGQNVEGRESTVQRMVQLGCEIGNHTWDHPSQTLPNMDLDSVVQEFQKTDDELVKACGQAATVCRAPYGAITEEQMAAVGKPFFMWSTDSLDWKLMDADADYNEIMNSDLSDGSIILMHDIHEPSVKCATEKLIPELVNEGYKLVTVSELAAAKDVTLQSASYSDFWDSSLQAGRVAGYAGNSSDSTDSSDGSESSDSTDVSDGSSDGSDVSDGSDDSSDGSDYSDGSSDDGSYDDGSYDDGSYDDGSEE